MQRLSRRAFVWTGAAATAAVAASAGYVFLGDSTAPLGFVPDAEYLGKARALLARTDAIDIHAHPGRTFVRDASGLSTAIWLFTLGGAFEKTTVEDMQAGGLAAASFAAVADFQVLEFSNGGLRSRRRFEPGEAWSSYQRQIANLKSLAGHLPVRIAIEPSDIAAARAQHRVAALLTVEGGDFLAGDLARLAVAQADGVRLITIVHYHNNEIGDIQTAAAENGGLTKFGEDAVREMGRQGIVVDLAHASEATARKALQIAERPVLCSHTHLSGAVKHPRFISPSLAQAIVEHGGVIGAWPAGIGMTTLSQFVDRIFALVEALGPDHVALGTDMDANYRPVMNNYRQMPLVVSELLRRGLGEVETVKFLSGNFMRVFEAVRADRN